MKSSVSKTYPRRETVVSDQTIYAALGVMAAVIEEPYCLVGQDELRELVLVHGRLSRAVFREKKVDYSWRDGCAVSGHDPSCVIKRGNPGAPGNSVIRKPATGARSPAFASNQVEKRSGRSDAIDVELLKSEVLGDGEVSEPVTESRGDNRSEPPALICRQSGASSKISVAGSQPRRSGGEDVPLSHSAGEPFELANRNVDCH